MNEQQARAVRVFIIFVVPVHRRKFELQMTMVIRLLLQLLCEKRVRTKFGRRGKGKASSEVVQQASLAVEGVRGREESSCSACP
jgi:hypothetical protein